VNIDCFVAYNNGVVEARVIGQADLLVIRNEASAFTACNDYE